MILSDSDAIKVRGPQSDVIYLKALLHRDTKAIFHSVKIMKTNPVMIFHPVPTCLTNELLPWLPQRLLTELQADRCPQNQNYPSLIFKFWRFLSILRISNISSLI